MNQALDSHILFAFITLFNVFLKEDFFARNDHLKEKLFRKVHSTKSYDGKVLKNLCSDLVTKQIHEFRKIHKKVFILVNLKTPLKQPKV